MGLQQKAAALLLLLHVSRACGQTPSTCRTAAEGSSCSIGRSTGVSLIQSQQRSGVNQVVEEADEEAILANTEEDAFCCFWAPDANDVCGSCRVKVGRKTWCGASQQRCGLCSTRATWCSRGPTTSPNPSPMPPPPPPPPRTPSPTPVPQTPSPTPMPQTPSPTPRPSPPTPAPVPRPPAPQPPSNWQGTNMKMTHYWDCSGQGCDAPTLQPWNVERYVSPPGYGPQDPNDFGGSVYGEKMWLTGAASDALSALMGDDDGCCGRDASGAGVEGCGKCMLVQNPQSANPDWTAVVMKKNRCPPWASGCGASQPHFDVAAPGFDNLQWSLANICGNRGTGFDNQRQSEAVGSWWTQCSNTAECANLCDGLPVAFRKGCRLFASWGWTRGNPDGVRFKAVPCPDAFVRHVASQFGPDGPTGF